MNKIVSTVLLSLSIGTVLAQIPVGAWRDHLPYSQCYKVIKTDNKIITATANNLFAYNTADNSIEKLSTISGLSDLGIATMEYNIEKKLYLIAYTNGNIDIVKGNVINNIADVKNKTMLGSKRANHIYFHGNYAYISFFFGILVVDLERLEIKDTYTVGEANEPYEVFSVVVDNTDIYAGTAKGIFKADVNDPFLVDYNRWRRIDNIPNSTGKFDKLAIFDGKVIANNYREAYNTDALYYLEGNSWNSFLPNAKLHKNELRVSGNMLLVSCQGAVYTVNKNFESSIIDTYGFDSAYPQSSLIDEVGNLWIADQRSGLVSRRANSSEFSSTFPNGPNTNGLINMLWSNGSLYVTAGGLDASWNNISRAAEFYKFSDETWTSVSNTSTIDYISVVADPVDPAKVYIGSWNNGVFVYDGNKLVEKYYYDNSPLQSSIPGTPFVRIGGMIFDDAKNLWIINSGVKYQLIKKKPNGEWEAFELALGDNTNDHTIGGIHQDRNGMFWIVVPRVTGSGISVFKSKNEKRFFNPKSLLGDVIPHIYCITSDNDGVVWVGTDRGVVTYSNPESVLDGNIDGDQPKIPRNDGTDIIDPLLGTETVNCMAVDGANRKWFGTEKGGAYLFSPDGTKEIHHFTTVNSPLFSNSIKSLAIDEKSGEVFFGTDQGIISYRSNATVATDDFTNVYVFPNPVREDYHGDIIITGLIADASVKITDVSGNLVYETKSLGGQAVWDGNTGGGKRVATGVYLIFCTNSDGTRTFVTKMLVVH